MTHSTFYLEEPLRWGLDAARVNDAVIADFNCNNGRRVISAVNYGAKHGYGFDISSGYIEQARSLASKYGADAGPMYWYHHSLSTIVQSALDAGCTLRQLKEYEHDVWVGYHQVEQVDTRPPLSMLVRFTS